MRAVGDYDIVARMQPELDWADVAPVLTVLQEHTEASTVTAERQKTRPMAGGPGLDIWLIGFTLIVGPLVRAAVSDLLYPLLKEKLLSVYRKLAAAPRGIELKPLLVAFPRGPISIEFRFPKRLTDADFDRALSSLGRSWPPETEPAEPQVVLLEYEPGTAQWVVNSEASAFLTKQARRFPAK